MNARNAKSKATADVVADLPNAELEVLALLWQLGSCTTRGMCDAIKPHRTMGLAAAQTLLMRLEAKGLVQRKKIEGRNAFAYSATTRPDPAYRRLTRRMLDRVFGGDPVQLMASLFATRQPTAEEIGQIEEMIAELKQGKRS